MSHGLVNGMKEGMKEDWLITELFYSLACAGLTEESRWNPGQSRIQVLFLCGQNISILRKTGIM